MLWLQTLHIFVKVEQMRQNTYFIAILGTRMPNASHNVLFSRLKYQLQEIHLIFDNNLRLVLQLLQ